MHPARSSDLYWLLAPVLALAAVVTTAQPADDRGFDPTGVWRGQHGSLVLMRARGYAVVFLFGSVRRHRPSVRRDRGGWFRRRRRVAVGGYGGDGDVRHPRRGGDPAGHGGERVVLRRALARRPLCPGRVAAGFPLPGHGAHSALLRRRSPAAPRASGLRGRRRRDGGARSGQRTFRTVVAGPLRRPDPDHRRPARTRCPGVSIPAARRGAGPQKRRGSSRSWNLSAIASILNAPASRTTSQYTQVSRFWPRQTRPPQ